MTLIRVYIATTDGPAEVQRIVEEAPDVRSVICLNGTAEALPVSASYDAFVRKPTGVVERETGHPVYRMDVSGRISEGHSWQFGVFVAHRLHSKGQLAFKGETADEVWLLTGEVDNHLSVGSVNHVAEKISKSEDLINETQAAGIPLNLFVPHDSAIDVGTRDGVVVVSARAADEPFALVDPNPIAIPEIASPTSDTPGPGLRRWVVSGLGLVIFGVVTLGGWGWTEASVWKSLAEKGVFSRLEQAMAESKIYGLTSTLYRLRGGAEAAVSLQSVEQRASAGNRCRTFVGGSGGLVEKIITEVTPGVLKSSASDRLCGIRHTVRNVESTPVYAWLSIVRDNQDEMEFRSRREKASTTIPAGASASVSIAFSPHSQDVSDYKIIIIATQEKSEDVNRWVDTMRNSAASSQHAVLDRLRRLGIAVKVWQHQIY